MHDARTLTEASGPLAVLERAFVRVNQWLVVALMGSMAMLVFVNVITRYVFNFSIIWAEEFSQYLMIWIAYLGAGLALREGRHVAVEMLQDRCPRCLGAGCAGCIWCGSSHSSRSGGPRLPVRAPSPGTRRPRC